MTEEVKIRIRGYRKLERHLKKLGARFTEEIDVTDTYFKQPAGEVLKITEDDRGDFLVKLKSRNGKFQIVGYEPVDDAEKMKRDMAKKFGVKCILKKKRRFFDFEGYKININLIEGMGEFLIVEGESLAPEIVAERLKIKNPEFVTVSFDELKAEK